jgi:hypothetical protein
MSNPNYELIRGDNIETVENVVNQRIKQGWSIQGGIVISTHMNKPLYIQTMERCVKKKLNEGNADAK